MNKGAVYNYNFEIQENALQLPQWPRLMSVLRRWLCCSVFVVFVAPIVFWGLVLGICLGFAVLSETS